MTRTVLIVSPTFPPSGLPPAHRTRQFARYLSEFGWKPVVLAVAPEFYQEQTDDELLLLVPPEVEVIRTKAIRPKWPLGLGVGDIGLRAFFQLKSQIKEICQSRRIDLMLLPCPPNYPILLGRWAKKRFGIPYVFDYIDPWQCDWLRKTARPFSKLWITHLLSIALEPYAIRDVSHVVSVSKGTNDGVQKNHPWLEDSQFTVLPYGGEPDVVEQVRAQNKPSKWLTTPDRFQLVYLGAMWEAAYGTLDAFLDAVCLLRDRNPEIYHRLIVHFLGTTYNPNAEGQYQVLPRAKQKGIEEVIKEVPQRLPFLEAIRTLINADGLLMLGSSEPHYTASRLLPYLNARSPLMAVFHEESDATRLLRRSGVPSALVTYGSDHPVKEKLEEIYKSLVRMVTSPQYDADSVDWNAVNEFSVRTMTAKLAQCFDGIVEAKEADV